MMSMHIYPRPSACNATLTWHKLLADCSGQPSLLPSVGQEVRCSSRATGLMPSVPTGEVVCLCAAPRVHLFAIAGNGWPHNAMVKKVKVWVLAIALLTRLTAALYNLRSGSWLAWANDTVPHYAAIHCPRWQQLDPRCSH